MEQLYFNTYYSDSDYIVLEEEPNDYQLKLWNSEWDAEKLKGAIGKYFWVSNSVKGWKPEIEEILSDYYGL